MSVTISMVPLAIAVFSTVSAAGIHSANKKLKKYKNVSDIPELQTKYNDITLLRKTLTEHGFKVIQEDENTLICIAAKGKLKFSRTAEGEPFKATISDLDDIDGLFCDLELLESEYYENVQSFTYDKLISQLGNNNMTLQSEQILEDNSILLTIDV